MTKNKDNKNFKLEIQQEVKALYDKAFIEGAKHSISAIIESFRHSSKEMMPKDQVINMLEEMLKAFDNKQFVEDVTKKRG